MKFNYVIVINKSIQEVSTAFEDPQAMKACQEGFVEIVHLTGKKGTKGATAKLVYKKFDLFETIIENNLPATFHAKYDEGQP